MEPCSVTVDESRFQDHQVLSLIEMQKTSFGRTCSRDRFSCTGTRYPVAWIQNQSLRWLCMYFGDYPLGAYLEMDGRTS